MEASLIAYGTLTLTALGILIGSLLIFAANKLAIAPNETVKSIEEILPNINCGACGYPGCSGYANAVAKGDANINVCAPGGEETARRIAAVLGMETPDITKMVAYLQCQGSTAKAELKFEYHGILECSQAHEYQFNGHKQCEAGCLGLGSCFRACPFEAITLSPRMLIHINPAKCTGCGLCIPVCPRDLIKLVPYREEPAVYQVACKSRENALNTRKQCQVGCFACGLCAKNCPVTAINVSNNLAVIDYNKCIGCNACEKVCPTKAINHLKKESHHHLFV